MCVGVTAAIGSDELCLKCSAGVVVNESSRGSNIGIRVGFRQVGQPLRLGYGIVIDEGHDITGCHCDSDIAGLRQVPLRTGRQFDPVSIPCQILFSSVSARSVDDADFKIVVVKISKTTECALEKRES